MRCCIALTPVGRIVTSGSCCIQAIRKWCFGPQSAEDSPTAPRNSAQERKMAHSNKQVTLARSAVDRRCHVCAFFHSREDEYKVMLPFLKEGLEADEKVIQIMDKRQREERLGATLRRNAALGEHGMGARGFSRRARRRRVRVAHQLHAAEIRHGHSVHLRLGEVQRRHRHGRAAHASAGDRRRHPAGEPVLRAAG